MCDARPFADRNTGHRRPARTARCQLGRHTAAAVVAACARGRRSGVLPCLVMWPILLLAFPAGGLRRNQSQVTAHRVPRQETVPSRPPRVHRLAIPPDPLLDELGVRRRASASRLAAACAALSNGLIRNSSPSSNWRRSARRWLYQPADRQRLDLPPPLNPTSSWNLSDPHSWQSSPKNQLILVRVGTSRQRCINNCRCPDYPPKAARTAGNRFSTSSLGMPLAHSAYGVRCCAPEPQHESRWRLRGRFSC